MRLTRRFPVCLTLGLRLLKPWAILLGLGLASQVFANEVSYVRIPAGNFYSVLSNGGASSEPVRVASFALRGVPVTVGEYLGFVQNHAAWQRGAAPAVFVGHHYLSQYPQAGLTDEVKKQAITDVSWFAAQAYCESEGARLPTWYEWEYVAAADATRADARGDPQWRSSILTWYTQPAGRSRLQVGGKGNFYGVRDMHGLIWEWVDDFNALLVSGDSRSQGDPDQLQYCGAGAISLSDRDNFAILMRVALLSSLNGSDSTSHLGFRCAKDIAEETR